MYCKFVGLTQEVAALIETRRKSPEQSENDIMLEVLRPSATPVPTATETFDLGQGVTVHVGEKLMLFLDEQAKKSRKPHGVADVRRDGIYVDGQKVQASRGSVITPAMRIFQERLRHRNALKEIISLNAFIKWHVIRDGQIVNLMELKDPSKTRKRGRGMTSEEADQFLKDLGLLTPEERSDGADGRL